uniref:Baculoviral IAP repeat containing 5b n=1 Tax=Amphiprion ocellaris TaxID=80972 RepID=A0AAQ5X0V8_AMPOC
MQCWNITKYIYVTLLPPNSAQNPAASAAQTVLNTLNAPYFRMAKAGFVHCPSENEPDVVCCFFCLIELEGWEPEDVPWSEHAKRSPNCGFLTMKKDFTNLTVAEYLGMEKDRLKIYLRKISHKKMASMREAIDYTLETLKSHLDS